MDQDWDYKVIHKNKNIKGEKAINQAIQGGAEVEAVQKHQHTNKADLDGKKVAEILNAEEEYKVDTVSHDFKIALQQARTAKKLTQAQLAQQVNEKETVIKEYENGKAIPNAQVIGKLERTLGVHLPRDKKKKKQSKDEQ